MSARQEPYVLYYRDGCHLCEDMITQLGSILSDYSHARLELRNVDANPEWLIRYDRRVPVLLYGQQLLSEYYLDEATLFQHLNGQQGRQ